MSRRASLPRAEDLFRSTSMGEEMPAGAAAAEEAAGHAAPPSAPAVPRPARAEDVGFPVGLPVAESRVTAQAQLTELERSPEREAAPQSQGRDSAAGAEPVGSARDEAEERWAVRSPAAARSGSDAAARRPAVRGTRGTQAALDRRPSGRERHDEKITVYVSAEELLDVEHARLVLRAEHGLSVDRGRIVREALAVVLADLHARRDSSILVRRLHGE